MQDFLNKNIVLGLSGGIAAYKSAYLVRELIRHGARVRVVMTQSAQAFITPLTLQALTGEIVRTEIVDVQAERAMGHIELARWADALVMAPASANGIAKWAHGLADDLLSTLYLVAEVPVFIAPAMNRSMWAHPATVQNVRTLRERGVCFIGPDEGSQACGETGEGRMSETADILDALRLYGIAGLLKGQKVLITAGATVEAIDPVRFISNHSSGKMGYALARAAQYAGAEVTLISGACALPPPCGVRHIGVLSAQAMYERVMAELTEGAVFIGCAAVADYAVANPQLQKIKKTRQPTLVLELTPNPDIIAHVACSGKAAYVVGFAAETQNVLEQARTKRVAKGMDMILANEVGEDKGFHAEGNAVTLITESQELALPFTHKTRLAAQIIEHISNVFRSFHASDSTG